MLQVEGFPLVRQWYVVWRHDQSLSAAARHFLAYIKQGAEQAGSKISATGSAQH
jgi:DNA-binding transcriptional LysR family regulator